MNRAQLESKIRRHWTEWLPKKVADLKAENQYEIAVQTTALAAQQRIENLMRAGYPDFAAEEVALSELVLLPPEKDAELEDWEREELDEMERNYQQNVAPYL